MFAALPNMGELQGQVLREVISRVADAFMPEAIICYGKRQTSHQVWSTFKQVSMPDVRSHYDILIITRSEEKYKDHEVLDKINQLNNESIRLTPVIHNIKAVQEAVQKGSRFFTTVCKNGILLYGEAKPEVDPVEVSRKSNESHWAHHFGLANQFLIGAEHYLSNAQPSLSVFMLHQAMEHACIAIIHACLGYRSTTHNLNRLLALTENISPELSGLFPRQTETERELFNMLVHAYGDVRYRQSFTIPPEQAKVLFERVRELISVTERIYLEFQELTEANEITDQELQPFESIGIDTFAHVVLQKGNVENIKIESVKDVSGLLKVHVDSGRLWITSPPDIGIIHEVTIIVTYKFINGLVVHRSGKVTCNESIEASWLGIIQNGRGNISLAVDVMALDVTLTKTGNLTITGSSEDVKVLNTGTGNVEASKLEATGARITIKGSGNVSIHVEEELSAVLQGTGDLILQGSPRLKSLASGTGQIKKSI